MKHFLLLVTLIALVGCATTPITSIREASAVPETNIFYKSEGSVHNVIFVRDSEFGVSALKAYLFMKIDPSYEKIKLANLDEGEMVGFSLKEGEYVFHVELNPIFGQVEDEISQKIESNKTYFFRIVPMVNTGFHLRRTSLKN
jgi:hypothetical protein